MPDEITGVVVLQEMPEPGVWRLWFQYTRSDGIKGYSSIPMKRKGDPEPKHEGPLWEFVERSPFLDCSPSVRILGPHDGAPDHFHNAGQWTNYYIVMATKWGEDPEAYDVVRTINQHDTKEKRDGEIFKGRALGVIK